jgi:hypothetical protein
MNAIPAPRVGMLGRRVLHRDLAVRRRRTSSIHDMRNSIFVLWLVAGCAEPPSVCARATQRQAWSEAVLVCGATAALDPGAAIAAGRAALHLGEFVEASWFATLAAKTGRCGDAATIRATVASADDAPDLALGYLAIAYAAHAAAGERLALARDAYQLAAAWSELGDLGRALEAAQLGGGVARPPGGRGLKRLAL